MTTKEKTSLYAGEIYLKIGAIVIRPSSVTIKKSLTTVTDTFSFTVPMWNDNGDTVYIPNTFGLEIDVYVNDTFYVGGILLRRIVQDNDIYCECSTHGWQLDNSNMYNEYTYQNGKTLGDFIMDVCKQNFQVGYRGLLTPIESFEQIKTTTDRSIFNLEALKKATNNTILSHPSLVVLGNITTKVSLKQIIAKRTFIKFIIYDPYDLYNINLSDFIQGTKEEKKIKSEYTETVFEYIKTLTKNINVFIKCIGIYDQIKDKLAHEKIHGLEETNYAYDTIYVLLLYRPGIDFDIYSGYIQTDLKETETKIGSNFTFLTEYNEKTISSVVPLYTRKFREQRGYIINNGTDNSNCLKNPVEEYTANNQYSVYILIDKNKQARAAYNVNQLPDNKVIENLNKLNLTFSKKFFNPEFAIGTVKVIKVDEALQENVAKKRLFYEINKARAESYKITAKVIGYTININFAKVKSSENIGNNFWDFGRIVRINSPKQFLDKNLIIEEMEMHYDSNDGAYTNLTLIHPLSYSSGEFQKISIEEETEIVYQKLKKEKESESFLKKYFKHWWYRNFKEPHYRLKVETAKKLTNPRVAKDMGLQVTTREDIKKAEKEYQEVLDTRYLKEEIKNEIASGKDL